MATAVVGGRTVAVTAGRDGVARVWEVDGGRLLGELPVGRWGSVALSALGDAPVVLAVGDYRPEFAWDLASGRCLQTLPADDAMAVTTTVLDGRPVAVTCHEDGTVGGWDLGDVRQPARQFGRPVGGHGFALHAVAAAAVGGRLLAVSSSGMNADQSWDEDVRLWDLTAGTPVAVFDAARTSSVDAVALADLDGRPVVATADWQGTVRLWEPSPGGRRQDDGVELRGHTAGVWTLAVTTLSGRPTLASGCDDGTVRRWDLATRQQIGQMLRFPHPVRALAAAPGDRLVVCFGPNVAVLAPERPSGAEAGRVSG
ncbi:WD40 repeat domain-containing protein [Kitasatospora aburaviensis]|uniref:WD40 repeat domain-containing protein n=1 Tax=Kitasatospora aburaviensis TaxID=67265 RepID=UPI00362DD8B2